MVPRTPIKDEARVDQRRASVALEPLAQYVERLSRLC